MNQPFQSLPQTTSASSSARAASPRFVPKIFRLLVASSVIAWGGLVLVLCHYRIPQKAWRRVMVEQRVVGWCPDYELNRNYQSSRELFRLYHREPDDILILGDSQVRLVSWGEFLGRGDVIGRGIDGDTVAGVRARLTDDNDSTPTAVVLIIGTNDVLRGSSIAALRNDFGQLINEAQVIWPQAKLLVVSVPPMASWVERQAQRNQGVEQINAWLREATENRTQAEFVDLAGTISDQAGALRQEMTMDGIHLSAAAFERLRVLLNERLPQEPK